MKGRNNPIAKNINKSNKPSVIPNKKKNVKPKIADIIEDSM